MKKKLKKVEARTFIAKDEEKFWEWLGDVSWQYDRLLVLINNI